MKRIILLFALLAGVALTLPPVVLAQQVLPQETETTENETRRGNSAEARQQRISERIGAAKRARIRQQCDTLQTRLEQIENRVTTLRESRGNLLNNLVRTLQGFAERVEAAGLDASALNEDVATLESMAAEISELWDAYQTALENVASSRCDQEGDAQSFHEALQAARIAREDVSTKIKEVRQFFTDEVKQSLADIRGQLSQDTSEEADDEEEDN